VRRLSRVDRIATRVALAATGVVLTAYLLVAAGVVLIVDRNLTAQIDSQLGGSLRHIAHGPPHLNGAGFEPPPGGPPGGGRFGPPLLVWTQLPDGTVEASDPTATLPVPPGSITRPQTLSIGGADVRVQGQPVGAEHLVVGISMKSVTDARSTIVAAEAIVGPVLLLAVFGGALTIGRRAAAPIESARRRQMEFTSDASHELRTPLSVIEATTALALGRERDSAWYHSAFERVQGESQRIRRLVEDLLWLARFDATREQPRSGPVDVGVIASEAAERFHALAEAGGLSLKVRVGDDPALVNAPAEWLDRLLGVLLDNACKYSPGGGEVEVSVGAGAGRTRLTVDDSGPGIPMLERDRIFDRFHRATDEGGGAGLGLAIANSVVRATHGRWEVGSAPAGGARMAVSWPSAERPGPLRQDHNLLLGAHRRRLRSG
jgi:signal transduction histidine kinase